VELSRCKINQFISVKVVYCVTAYIQLASNNPSISIAVSDISMDDAQTMYLLLRAA
jgi:hypothetical protein